MQFDRNSCLTSFARRAKSAKVQQAIQELRDKIDHEQHAALLQKFGLDPGKLAEKAAESGVARL